MARIKINDLSKKDMEMTDEELKKVFGGALTLNRDSLTISTRRIFMRPTFIEWNDEEEHIFNTTQRKY